MPEQQKEQAAPSDAAATPPDHRPMTFHARGDEHFTAMLVALPPEAAEKLPPIPSTHIYVMYLCRVRMVHDTRTAGQIIRAHAAEGGQRPDDPELVDILRNIDNLEYPIWLPTPTLPFAVAIAQLERASLPSASIITT